MPTIHTHYDNLKVTRNAPVEVIEAAYRALAQKYHPERDSSTDAARIMALVSHAYSVLVTPELRREHDQWIRQAEAEAHGFGNINDFGEVASKKGRLWPHRFVSGILVGLGVGIGMWYLWPSVPSSLLAPSSSTASNSPRLMSDPTLPIASSDTSAEFSVAPPPKITVPDESKRWVVTGPDKPISEILRQRRKPIDSPVCGPQLQIPPTDLMHSVYRDRGTEKRDWPHLTFATGDSTGNAYVKVIDTSNSQPVATVFIRQGERAEVHLKPGVYKIHYATVDRWYGEDYVTVEGCGTTAAVESDKTIQLEAAVHENQFETIDTVTIELWKQLDGNFATHGIPINDL